jgi:heme/copper-type cytochrome/quinol oxidase subunit 3
MQPEQSTGSSTLFRIAGVGASLAFGVMVASLFALKSAPDGFSFELNVITVIAFLAAATAAWFYWRLIARMAVDRAPERRKKKFVAFSIGLVLVGLISFLYPLKFIAAEKRKDVFVGLAMAAGCILGVGFVMMKVKRFLDADLKKSEEDDRE